MFPWLTATNMDLIEGVFRRRQHPHVRSELFCQRLDHILRGGRAGHSDTLCGEVPRHTVLEVKAHHAMELQILKEEKEYNNNQFMWFQHSSLYTQYIHLSRATFSLPQKFISCPSAVKSSSRLHLCCVKRRAALCGNIKLVTCSGGWYLSWPSRMYLGREDSSLRTTAKTCLKKPLCLYNRGAGYQHSLILSDYTTAIWASRVFYTHLDEL